MRPLCAVVLFTLVALSASAAIHFEPVNPTERTFVVMQLRETWPYPDLPAMLVVERTGRRIEVKYQTSTTFCYTQKTPWISDVPLGLLPAGRYDVVVVVDSAPVATSAVVVRQQEPPLVAEPQLIRTDTKTLVRIQAPSSNSDICKPSAEVEVDGVRVESSRQGCEHTIELGPHPAGSVDIRVRVGDNAYESVGAVHYVDPNAAPDPVVYERMLAPVVLNADGAFGSSWQTRASIYNRSFADIEWLPAVSRPLCTGANCVTKLPARTSQPLGAWGEHPEGLVLFVPRNVTSSVRFSSIVQNPRDRSQYGTEVRVIREQDLRKAPFMIPDVPFDPRYRVQLRVYGVDGATTPVYVGVTVGEDYWAQHPIEMKAPCTIGQLPCNSNSPAYGSIDLGATFPWLFDGSANPIYVYPGASQYPLRYWAFVSITDNETQHVTIITPH